MGKLSGMVADEARLDDLKAFLPQAVLTRLDAQQDEWTGEIRTVSIMFVNLGIKPASLCRGLTAPRPSPTPNLAHGCRPAGCRPDRYKRWQLSSAVWHMPDAYACL